MASSISHLSGTIDAPIVVDDRVDDLQKYAGLPYGTDWLRSTPVALLLEPKVLPQVAGNRSKPLTAIGLEPDSVVRTAEQLKKVKFIPSAETLIATVEKLKAFPVSTENGGPWFHFRGSYFQYRATHGMDCRFLDEILQSSKTIEDLHVTRRWIRDLDPDFQHWFQEKATTLKLQDVLLAEKHLTVDMQSILPFSHNEWLNNSCLDAICLDWKSRFGDIDGRQTLFIPSSIMASWSLEFNRKVSNNHATKNSSHVSLSFPLDMMEAIKDGRSAALYTFVYLGYHWGAIKVDFRERYISVGDGMNYGDESYKTATGVMRALIEQCFSKSEYNCWDAKRRFPKTVQPISDSSSCGVIAAYMIEKSVLGEDPAAEWDDELNLEYRGRYFARALGYQPDLTLVPNSPADNITNVLSQMAIKKVDDMVRTSTSVRDDTSDDCEVKDYLRCEDYLLFCDEEMADERRDEKEGDRKEGDEKEGDRREGDQEGDRKEGDQEGDDDGEDEKHSQSSRTKPYHRFKADLAEEHPPLDTTFTRLHIKTNKESNDSMSDEEYHEATRLSKTPIRPAPAVQDPNTNWDFDVFENINEDDSMDEDEEGIEYGFDEEGSYRVPVKVGDIDADILIDWAPLVGHRFVSRAAADTFLRSWALKKGFKLVLRSSKPRSLTYTCYHHGKPKTVKVLDPEKQHNKAPSRRCGCTFALNLTSPLRLGGAWHITTVHPNHVVHPFDDNLGRTTPLTDQMIASIAKCAQVKLSYKQTLHILHAEFPEANPCRYQILNRLKELRTVLNATMVPQTIQLLVALCTKASEESGWFVATDIDDNNRLVRVFWMSPGQRLLYRRYGDAVVNDNTYKTNSLGMPLHCYVVVDSENRTRLVATGLTRTEQKKDYLWMLEKLREASVGFAPSVILVDQDPGLDTALRQVYPETQVINCIWHLKENLKRHLSSILGPRYQRLLSVFDEACEALTPTAFENIWDKLLEEFGGDGNGLQEFPTDMEAGERRKQLCLGKVGKYLSWLYERHTRWAGPWVQAVFTAGMRATQRVESNHYVLKLFLRNSGTTLPALLQAILNKVEDECDMWRYIERTGAQQAGSRSTSDDMLSPIFEDVLENGRQFFSFYAQSQLRSELEHSFGFKVDPTNLNLLSNGTDQGSTLNSSGDWNATQVGSVRAIINNIKHSQVEATYQVLMLAYKSTPPPAEYVILLKDLTYFCSCALRENKGLPCRHYFAVMQADGRFLFHPSLTHTRWYKESRQLDPNLRTDLTKVSFVIAHTYAAEATRSVHVGHLPSSAFLDNMGLIFQPQPIIQKAVDETKVLGPKVIVAVKSLVNRVKKIAGGCRILENLYAGIRQVEEEAKNPGSTAASILQNRSLDEIQDGTRKKRGRPSGTQREKAYSKKMKSKARESICGKSGMGVVATTKEDKVAKSKVATKLSKVKKEGLKDGNSEEDD